jgi:hypothetical protein
LPVSYRLQEGHVATCELTTSNGQWTISIPQPAAECGVVASQPGNSRYAPAPDVIRTFGVEFQIVTLTWLTALHPLTYHTSPGATNVVRIQLRATSGSGYKATFGLGASGPCSAPAVSVSEGPTAVITAELTLSDPAVFAGPPTCELRPFLDSADLSNSSATVRDYHVISAP